MSRNRSTTQKFVISGAQTNLKGYLLVDEGEAGELLGFAVELDREGSMSRALVRSFSAAVNKGLQAGVPLSVFVAEFKDWRFEPSGPVQFSSGVSECSSVVDYIVRELEHMFPTVGEASPCL
jgi:hypothetical protein